MQVAILCGGRGMRLNGGLTPKALADVKGKPLVRHVMDVYGRDHKFTLLTGHKHDEIAAATPFSVAAVWATGDDAKTGERLIKWGTGRAQAETFCVAYCDCLADIDIDALLAYHRSHGKLATLVAVPAVSSKGVLGLQETDTCSYGQKHKRVTSFREKPVTTDWVNFGYFVFEPGVLELLDDRMLEDGLLPRLAEAGQLMAYKHHGWFASVDSPKELEQLNAVEGTPWLRS